MKKACILFCTLLLVNITSCGFSREVTCNCNCCKSSISSEETTQSSTEVLEEDSQITSEDIVIDHDDYLDTQTEEELKEREEEEKIYQKAKKDYISGKWDGMPKIINGDHILSRSQSGYILLDSFIIGNYQENVDLPDNFDFNTIDSCNVEFVPGNGTYVIKDNHLVKYLRGKEVTLKGGSLNIEGFKSPEEVELAYHNNDPELYYEKFDKRPYLYYCKDDDTLLLITSDLSADKQYLYKFPDCDVSEVQYIGKIYNLSITGSVGPGYHYSHFFYEDENGTTWEYTKGGPAKVDVSYE